MTLDTYYVPTKSGMGSGQVESHTDRPIIHFGSPQGTDYTPPVPPVPEPPEEPGAEPKREPKPQKPPKPPKDPNRTKSLWRLFR